LWVVADEELLAATVTPECSHLLEAYRFLAATLFYCYRPHVLILDQLAILLAASSMVVRFVSVMADFDSGLGLRSVFRLSQRR
jgi:transposase-like protein